MQPSTPHLCRLHGSSMQCLLINYDYGSQSLLSQYMRRAGCQEFILTTGPAGYSDERLTEFDLIFLHLTSPDEVVREELAFLLRKHVGVVITSPFPRHQFPTLFIQPFAFLTEPFSFKKFTECIDAYQRVNGAAI